MCCVVVLITLQNAKKLFEFLVGLGQNALGLTLGTTAAPSTTANEGLGGIDFSSSSDKKSKFVLKHSFFLIDRMIRTLQQRLFNWVRSVVLKLITNFFPLTKAFLLISFLDIVLVQENEIVFANAMQY